jgi:electron transport complex protein RnfD
MMDKRFETPASPFTHCGASTQRIMLDVIIALLPATVAAIVIFGAPALVPILSCVIAAVLSEFLFNVITHRKQSIGDLSAVVTGLLLGLNLSTNVPVWQCVIGSVFAIVFVKCLFGGLGHNFANPAITARVFMLVSFTQVMGGAMPKGVDLVTSATPLEVLSTGGEGLPSLLDMFLGVRGGAVGETCVIALLIGFAYLVVRRVIRWYVPAIFVGSVFVLYFVTTGSAVTALYEIMAGGLFLGAIFMATDYQTSPINNKGKAFFALGCGILTFVIREYCAYPEGVSLSILVMNILAPMIEKWTAATPLGLGGPKNAK